MTDKAFATHKYLSQYKELKCKTAELQDKVELFESAVTALCKALTTNESKHAPFENKTELKHVILVDLKNEIGVDIAKHLEICGRIEWLITKADKDGLLRDYYIKGISLQDIAKRKDRHEMTIRRTRNRLLDTTYGMAMHNSVGLTTTY